MGAGDFGGAVDGTREWRQQAIERSDAPLSAKSAAFTARRYEDAAHVASGAEERKHSCPVRISGRIAAGKGASRHR